MRVLNVLAVIGGISKDSLNKRLYNELVKHNTTNLALQTYEIASLPFYSQDAESAPPESVVKFQEAVRRADGILFITPEYNRSFPGVLKNAIDWCSRPYGSNLWKRKPAALLGASMGKIGTFGAQQHLRNICSFLDIYLMHQPEFYLDASASMNDDGLLPDAVGFSQNFLRNFEQWLYNHSSTK